MRWIGPRTWVSLLLLAPACFDPNDADLGSGNEGTSSGGSQSATESSPTEPTSGNDDSVDTSAGSDPSATDSTLSSADTSGEDDATTGATRPDMGVTGLCDTFDPMCPDGFKCSVHANDGTDLWNEMFCVPLDPDPVGRGAACNIEGGTASGIDNCDSGLMCWNVDPDTGQGACIEFCEGTAANPTCDAGFGCVQLSPEVVYVCLPTCDPLIQDCMPGDGCYPLDLVFICAPDGSGGFGPFGQECMFINECEPGLFCANPDSVPGCLAEVGGCCTSFCDVTDANASANCPGFAGGQQCIVWYEEGFAPPGLEDVGACAIP